MKNVLRITKEGKVNADQLRSLAKTPHVVSARFRVEGQVASGKWRVREQKLGTQNTELSTQNLPPLARAAI